MASIVRYSLIGETMIVLWCQLKAQNTNLILSQGKLRWKLNAAELIAPLV